MLHIKIRPKTANNLKRLARTRSVAVGELVRQAVSRCYQADMTDLGESQYRAVVAYQGGYISMGKLAEEFGKTVLETRCWLADHDIPQNNIYSAGDAKNA
jgi:hypothetical protein